MSKQPISSTRTWAWHVLFDPGELEAGCSYARDAVGNPKEASAAVVTLKSRVIDPLDAYIKEHLPPPAKQPVTRVRDGVIVEDPPPRLNSLQARLEHSRRSADEGGFGRGRPIHIEAAEQLGLQVRRIMLWLEFPAFNLTPEEAHAALREAWRDFIIAGAAHLIYDGHNQMVEQRRHASQQPRGKSRGVTPQVVADAVQASRESGEKNPVEAAAKRLGISLSTAYRRLKQHARQQRPLSV